MRIAESNRQICCFIRIVPSTTNRITSDGETNNVEVDNCVVGTEDKIVVDTEEAVTITTEPTADKIMGEAFPEGQDDRL